MVSNLLRLLSVGLVVGTISEAHADILTPSFSHSPGFYDEPVQLSIDVDHPEAEIYYTTDGSEPSQDDYRYEGPLKLDSREGDPNVISEIPTNSLNEGHPYRENWVPPQGEVFKINVIRARAFLEDDTAGEIASASYLIDPDSENGRRYTMPVVSIHSDPDNFFDDEKGIYVEGQTGANFHQRGREWERPVHIEFFEEDGTMGFGQDAGIRIHGGTTRNRPRKSLRLYARSDYGKTWFNYPIFTDKPVPRYKRFILRNSGNDWSEAVFRDAYLQRLIQYNTEIDVQYSRPAIVFLNGEYWGIHNIRDRYDGRYLESHYGVDPDRITIMENNAGFDKGSEEGAADYDDFYKFVTEKPMSLFFNYEEVQDMMDVDNFIDYQILHIFTRNTDWPGNNKRYWKYLDGTTEADMPEGQDGRWRWMAFDLDFGFGQQFDYVYNSGAPYGDNNPFHNTIAFAMEDDGPDWPNPPWSTALLRNLMENGTFRNTFINRFANHLNTSFHPDRATALLDSMKSLYQPEMEEHIKRWTEPDYAYWQNDLSIMRDFAENRADAMFDHLNDYFNLNGTQPISLDVNDKRGGRIVLNGMEISSGIEGIDAPAYPWEGTYFSGEPITLVARPEAGYEFTGWSGDISESADTVEVSLDEFTSIYANFRETEDFEGDEMNPPAYDMKEGSYRFDYWSVTEPEGSFPDNMVFQQSSVNDPTLNTEMTDPYFIPYVDEENNEYHADDQDKVGYPYSLTGRTRINGLGEEGISLINTGRGRDLGAVVLALDTRQADELAIHWLAETRAENSRKYNIRLQYRIGMQNGWDDVLDQNGQIVEYERSYSGHKQIFDDIPFPEDAYGHSYVQLRWKYYYTGNRVTEDFGRRDELRIDDIEIEALSMQGAEPEESPHTFTLKENYPNPFNPTTRIVYELHQNTEVDIEIFSIDGRLLYEHNLGEQQPGLQSYEFDGSGLSSGVYLYRVHAGGESQTQKMTLVK